MFPGRLPLALFIPQSCLSASSNICLHSYEAFCLCVSLLCLYKTGCDSDGGRGLGWVGLREVCVPFSFVIYLWEGGGERGGGDILNFTPTWSVLSLLSQVAASLWQSFSIGTEQKFFFCFGGLWRARTKLFRRGLKFKEAKGRKGFKMKFPETTRIEMKL